MTPVAEIAASFQDAVGEVLVAKTIDAAQRNGAVYGDITLHRP